MRVTLFLLANVNRLAIVTLRTVRVDPPFYIMTSDAAYAVASVSCHHYFWQCALKVGTLGFVSFIQILLLPFRSQTLVICTSLVSSLQVAKHGPFLGQCYKTVYVFPLQRFTSTNSHQCSLISKW